MAQSVLLSDNEWRAQEGAVVSPPFLLVAVGWCHSTPIPPTLSQERQEPAWPDTVPALPQMFPAFTARGQHQYRGLEQKGKTVGGEEHV